VAQCGQRTRLDLTRGGRHLARTLTAVKANTKRIRPVTTNGPECIHVASRTKTVWTNVDLIFESREFTAIYVDTHRSEGGT